MVDRTGQQLGNYVLKGLLGQGGFADVYLGEHVYLKRLVAVKVLQMRMTKNELQEFVLEAQILAWQWWHAVRVHGKSKRLLARHPICLRNTSRGRLFLPATNIRWRLPSTNG